MRYLLHSGIALYIIYRPLSYPCAEWEEGELHHFEALNSARDADYSYTVGNARKEISDCHFPAADKQPDNVGYRVCVKVQIDLFAEGGKGKRGCLEALSAERDPYYRNAEEKSDEKPGKRKPQPSENYPDDVC